jgi:S-DNA-T family DNA segregation ATPase FtsK/SpoIIIE
MNRDEVYAGADLTEPEIEAARKFLIEKPSTSYLQRRMQIPYGHALRLVEYFEAAGLVSAPNSAGLRTVRK